MTNRAQGDYGYKLGLAVSGWGLAAAVLAARAHEDGLANVRAQREASRQAIEDARVSADLVNGQRLSALAAQLVEDLRAEREENARLRKLLAQRQVYIDSLRRQ